MSNQAQSPTAVKAEVKKKLGKGEQVSFKEFVESEMSIKDYVDELFDAWSGDGSDEIDIDELRDFERKDLDDSLLGERLVCHGGSLVLQGSSGIGKSTLELQASVCWCLGRDFFGIKPKQPLRILFIQSENNVGDMAEAFQDITAAMKLTDDDFRTLERNLVLKHQTSLTGTAFVKYAADQIHKHKLIEKDYVSPYGGRKFDKEWPIDLVIADPLLCYIGGDVTRQDVVSKFLRNELQPLLDASFVAWIWVHHTNKPRSGKGPAGEDRMYASNGSSEITNWARAIMTLDRKSGGKFVLSIDKRGQRSPWKDKAGNRVTELALQHSKTGIIWEPADGGAIVNFDSAYAADREVSSVRDFITEKGTVTLDALKTAAPTLNGKGIGVNRAIAIAKTLGEEPLESGIYTYHVKAKGNTNNATVFSTQPPAVVQVTKPRKAKKVESARLRVNSHAEMALN